MSELTTAEFLATTYAPNGHNGTSTLESPHSWQPNSLITLAAHPPEPPTIGGLLYPGKRTVLSGETESMKTWLALILCKAELDLGLTVAWVDLDAMGPGAMLERLTLLGVDQDTLHDRFLYIQPAEMLDPGKISYITETVHARQIRLLIIDAFNPILSLHNLDPNSTPDIETFWRTIADPIADAGAAPVLLDHVVKNAENRGKYAYGSERKASGAIVHIGFRLLETLFRGGRGRSLLTVHKDRPGVLPRPTLGRLVLDSAEGTGEITYTLEPDKSHDAEGAFRPTVLMEKISVYLELHPGAATGNEIEHSVTGKAEALRTARTTLISDGYIKQTPGQNRAVHYSSIRPYREAQDDIKSGSSPVRPGFVPELRSSTRSGFVPEPPHGGEGRTEGRRAGRTRDGFVPEPIPEYDHDPTEHEHPDWENQ